MHTGQQIQGAKCMYVCEFNTYDNCTCVQYYKMNLIQEGLAVASIVRDDPSTLPGDDPFRRARMHRDRNAW